jgi:hypothetical protein
MLQEITEYIWMELDKQTDKQWDGRTGEWMDWRTEE